MPVPTADILAEVRKQLREPTPAFWTNLELYGHLNEWLVKQHQIVVRNLILTERASQEDHPYAVYYRGTDQGALIPGQTDQPVAPDILYALQLQVGDPLVQARRISSDEEGLVYIMPQYRPVVGQALWLMATAPVATAPTSGQRMIRVFTAGGTDGYTPSQPDPWALEYLRRVTLLDPAAPDANVDIEPEWVRGPIAGTVGRAKVKQNVDPSPWFGLAADEAQRICPLPPPTEQPAPWRPRKEPQP